MCLALATVLLAAAGPRGPLGPVDPLDADAPASTAPDEAHHFVVFPMPLLGYNSDEGIGAGLVVSLHDRVGNNDILKNELALRFFATSSLVQRHELRWEGVDVLGLPVRIWARLGFFSTTTQVFCGRGNGVTCDDAVAREQALARGLHEDSEAFDEFVRHYYLVRYVRPHADTLWRWRITEKPHAIEIFHGWRGEWFFPGTLFERGPYPGSLYASVYPRGEPGISSVLQVGFDLDNRDYEPAPSAGSFFEASVRASHPWLGSAWTWAGLTASAQDYELLLDAPHVVWANRLLIDLIVGDAATEDIMQIGGTRNYAAFGGQWIGRGVRDHRYLGKLKAIEQSELRLDLGGFSIVGVRIDLGLVAFGDVGWIAWDWRDLTGAGGSWPAGNPVQLVYGGGVGVRAVINRASVAQVEMAGSPFEQRTPSFYTPVGNAW